MEAPGHRRPAALVDDLAADRMDVAFAVFRVLVDAGAVDGRGRRRRRYAAAGREGGRCQQDGEQAAGEVAYDDGTLR